MSELNEDTRPTRAPRRYDTVEAHGGSRAPAPYVPDPQRDEYVAFPSTTTTGPGRRR